MANQTIPIKNLKEIELMKKAGKIVAGAHHYIKPHIKEGITTKELDSLVEKYIRSEGAIPSFKNYNGFSGSICASINEEVVHGIPGNRKLKEGDIISIDIGACFEGYHGDSAWTYAVGTISNEVQKLLTETEHALYEGISMAKEGARVGDIGFAIESHINKHGYGIVKELVGHGVGKKLHEEPDVPNYGRKGTGPILREGMVLAIEPMINLGSSKVYILEDDWTIVTSDNSRSAHFEHTVLVTKSGPEILTKR